MIYWRIKQPGKSWRNWQDGVSDDVLDAQVDAMSSVMDEDNKLLPWADGIVVEMFEMKDIEDWKITKERAKSFRENYLGIRCSEVS